MVHRTGFSAIAEGALVALTVDNGMADKSGNDGMPNVMCPITDTFVDKMAHSASSFEFITVTA